MTVWRLPGRRLALHSPVPIDDATAAELAGLGEVTDVIAPNRLHTTWFAATTARYPGARAWASGRAKSPNVAMSIRKRTKPIFAPSSACRCGMKGMPAWRPSSNFG